LFMLPEMFTPAQMDARMDAGVTTFALDIPPNFQRDMLAGRKPAIQLNVAGLDGNSYVQAIVTSEVKAFAERYRGARRP
jgi:ABC-2 type transport system permease protein